MKTAEARTLAQSDPVPNLTQRFGETTQEARKLLQRLTLTLCELDDIAGILAEHDVTVSVDLGPVGNSAAATRRDLEKQRDTPTFELPR